MIKKQQSNQPTASYIAEAAITQLTSLKHKLSPNNSVIVRNFQANTIVHGRQ